jgi:hypothetical protein
LFSEQLRMQLADDSADFFECFLCGCIQENGCYVLVPASK